MLICIDNAHYSIVADYNETESLLVRARHVGDINRYWPDVIVTHDAGVDFTERAVIPRYKVAGLLSDLILNNPPADMKPHTSGLGSSYYLENSPPIVI